MYGNISITELFSRLHFLENHTRCQSDELAKKQQKIDEQTEEIKRTYTQHLEPRVGLDEEGVARRKVIGAVL